MNYTSFAKLIFDLPILASAFVAKNSHFILFFLIEKRKNSYSACFDMLYKINQRNRSNSKKEGFLIRKGFKLKKIGFKIQVKKKKSLVRKKKGLFSSIFYFYCLGDIAER